MKALLFERKEARYVAAAIASRLGTTAAAAIGPLRLTDIDPPEPPNPRWQTVYPRLTGICGSDLATVGGNSSRYFDPLVSFPFVPGHEVVGTLTDGSRVAIEPVLGPASRGVPTSAADAAPGDSEDYGYLLQGPIDQGIQIGFCASTGGGWGTQLIAHDSQIHEVPGTFSDEDAVMLEPAAGGVHAVSRAAIEPGMTVAVLGSGTMGLCTIAALRHLAPDVHLVATAKHKEQRRWALELGADLVVEPGEIRRAVRRISRCAMVGNDLAGGTDVTIDCLGNAASLTDSISVTRPRGRVVMVGMPGVAKVDLTPLWHRETELVGAYTYGTDPLPGRTEQSSFAVAFELVSAAQLGRLVTAAYPLDRYVDAMAHATEAGRRGAVKIVFDLRDERR